MCCLQALLTAWFGESLAGGRARSPSSPSPSHHGPGAHQHTGLEHHPTGHEQADSAQTAWEYCHHGQKSPAQLSSGSHLQVGCSCTPQLPWVPLPEYMESEGMACPGASAVCRVHAGCQGSCHPQNLSDFTSPVFSQLSECWSDLRFQPTHQVQLCGAITRLKLSAKPSPHFRDRQKQQ